LESFTDGLAITIEARYEGDQLVRLEENGEVVLSFVYDANGFLAKQIFFDGKEINYTHNNQGELTALQHVFGPSMIFSYHTEGPGAGLLKSMGFQNSLAELTYDDLGRLQTMTSEGSTINYSYLAFGKTRIEQDGRAFVETTDQFNNLISVRGPEGREAHVEDREGKTTYTSASGASLSLDYDEGGYLSRLVNAAGVSRKVTVDPVLELLTSVTDPHGG
jgi:YD repeat-containing protein